MHVFILGHRFAACMLPTADCCTVRSPGLTGTAALVLGYFLHLNPYGSFHVSLDALLLGVACCAPVIALGTLLPPALLPTTWSVTCHLHGQQARHVA